MAVGVEQQKATLISADRQLIWWDRFSNCDRCWLIPRRRCDNAGSSLSLEFGGLGAESIDGAIQVRFIWTIIV